MKKLKNSFMRHTALTAGALAISATASFADQVIADDLIVQGSACVGLDCVNGESFGFSTIIIKENNLRITARDTSNSASFPSTDWNILFNDTANGGTNKFAIQDLDANRVPFTIVGGAPNNSLVVDSQGDLGVGTASPVVKMHQVTGNTPTLRLEQDGSSGFTAQTWDLAGNEANFFIRDATNGSTLPFRIQPGAGTNSLSIDDDDDIGMGIQTPEAGAALHVRRTDGEARLLVEEASSSPAARRLMELRNNGVVVLRMTSTEGTDHIWNIQNRGSANNNEFRIVNAVGAGEEFILSEGGNLTITGSITTGGGTCGGGCDAVFTDDYPMPTIAEHSEAMFSLGYLPNVGPTIENEPINVSDKLGRMLNELEHAHIFISQQNEAIVELTARLNELETQLVD